MELAAMERAAMELVATKLVGMESWWRVGEGGALPRAWNDHCPAAGERFHLFLSCHTGPCSRTGKRFSRPTEARVGATKTARMEAVPG